MVAKVRIKPPKVKAPKPKSKSKSKDRKGSEESEQGEAAAAGTDPGGYEEWLGRNTGSYNSSTNATLPPIPIEWNISPTNLDSVQCPSVGGTVGWFIATDLFSAGASFFLCLVLASIFEPIGYGDDKKRRKGCWATQRIWLTWLIGFAFEALGNLINAAIVVTSKGYGKLALGHVFLVYSSRPRIKIWLHAIFRFLWDEEDYSFRTAYVSLAIVEVILHIMSATFVGITWSRYPNEPIKEYMSSVTVYMQVAAGILVLAVLLVAPIWHRSKDPQWFTNSFLDFILLLFFGAVYAAPWAYWGMFLQLPGPLWCPPKIASQGVVWVVFSTLGTGFSI